MSFIARNGRPSGSVPTCVDRRDAGVLELAGDAGLVGEPAGGADPGRVPLVEDLHGHVAVQGEVGAR